MAGQPRRSIHMSTPRRRPVTGEKSLAGAVVALRVDHTVEEEVEALFQRVECERGRVDVLVNSIAGEDPLMAQWCSFCKTDLKNAEAAPRQSLLSHIITAKRVKLLGYSVLGDYSRDVPLPSMTEPLVPAHRAGRDRRCLG